MIILLLVALLVLHVFWTFLIVRVVIRTLTQGEAKVSSFPPCLLSKYAFVGCEVRL